MSVALAIIMAPRTARKVTSNNEVYLRVVICGLILRFLILPRLLGL